MKSFIRLGILVFLAIALLYPQKAIGHDGWIELSPAIVEKGQPVIIALMLGNHSNGHKSYRLAGKWEPKYTSLVVIDPQGKETDLTTRLVDMGEDEEKIGPKGPKGFHVALFTAKEQGSYLVIARQERLLQFGNGPKFRNVQIARAVFTALPVPTIAEAKKTTGFDRKASKENFLEIVPVTNPAGVIEGSPITLEVRYKGKPAPGRVVSIIRRIDGPVSAKDFTSDGQGRVSFSVGPADSYLARVNFDEESERAEGQYDKSSYEATYVFQVFNRP